MAEQLALQAEDLPAQLERLRGELTEVRRQLAATRVNELLEANERLVVAALRAETIAEETVEELHALARAGQRDVLTDTPNRAAMRERMEIAIDTARRQGKRLAVVFVDLDDLKGINDTLGHEVGDAVLQSVARRLQSVVRDADSVSRHGGDEFLVLLTEVETAADAARVARTMLAALLERGAVGEKRLPVSASLGVSLFPDHGDSASTLIRRADSAMYRAKRRHSGVELYREETASRLYPDETASRLDRRDSPSRRPPGRPAIDEQDPRLRDLCDANEQLVISALAAQTLGAQAAEAHGRQIKFLATVAHELRNPLTPILTAAEILNRARDDDSVLPRVQAVLTRQVAHMTRLVEDLLDGSRVSTGKFALQRAPTEMTEVFHMAVEACQPAMVARHQRFTLRLPPPPLRVHGDPVRLAQVFSNLLCNASKYTPEGGDIELVAVVADRELLATVTDDGIGITAEALPNIFELFVQDSHAASHHAGGLGIGLAVVRELVEGHGGTVAGKSEGSGLGSEFTVRLPLAAESPATADG